MRSILCASLVSAFGFLSQAQQTTGTHDLTEAGNRGDVSEAEKCLASTYKVTSFTGTITNHEQALDSSQNTRVHLLGNGAVATRQSTVSDSNLKTGGNPENRWRTISGSSETDDGCCWHPWESGGTAVAGDMPATPNCQPEMKARDSHVRPGRRAPVIFARRARSCQWVVTADEAERMASERNYSRKVAREIRSPLCADKSFRQSGITQ